MYIYYFRRIYLSNVYISLVALNLITLNYDYQLDGDNTNPAPKK